MNKIPVYLKVDTELHQCLTQLKDELNVTWCGLLAHLYRSHRATENRKAVYVAEPDDIEE